MKQTYARVIANDEIARDYYKMEFSWDSDAGIPLPGQFITIRVTDATVPLLRRPFAFSGYNPEKGEGSIIYLKRGRGTEILSRISPGENVDIIGPLGNYLKNPGKKEKPILIAGGIGLGPILYYSSILNRKGIPHRFIFGVRTEDAVPEAEIRTHARPDIRAGTRKDICIQVICTDDGSKGFHGTVLDYCQSLPKDKLHNAVLYCCGPGPMLKACHEFAVKHNLPCYVVMEQIMACGVGACMGCTIKVKSKPGFARVCLEGPVFESREIVWT